MTNLYSADAEKAIIGILIFDNSTWKHVRNLIRPEDFYDPTHIVLFNVISKILEKGQLIDIISLSESLKQSNLMSKIGGGEPYLVELVQNSPSPTNIVVYLSIVKKLSRAREIETNLSRMQQAISRNDENCDQIILSGINLLQSLIANPSNIRGVTLSELLTEDLPLREFILAPWLPKAGLCMVYAERGIGKTYFALEIAMAVAYGSTFLSFQAQKPYEVLYLDGEMPANTMQERIAEIEKRKQINPNMIEPIFITPDLQAEFMPNLSTVEGQEMVAKYVEKADLIIIDNISTLCSYGRENETESWLPIQEWLLKLRRMGKTVLLVHHAGKNGKQRGTSKREDILDTVIRLNRPSDYEPSMGACFELHFEKARGMIGDATNPIRCQLNKDGWVYEELEVNNYHRAVDLHKEGLKQSEIADELGISKGQVSKLLKKARLQGDICG